MATRTFKFLGKAYAPAGQVNLAVKFNGAEVYNGAVTTAAGSAPGRNTTDLDVLFSWDGSTDTTGQIPVEITVSGGTLFFGAIWGNYSGCEKTIVGTDPNDPSVPVFNVTVQPSVYFGDLNKNNAASDGKTNVKIDGVAVNDRNETTVAEMGLGDWQYAISSGSVFTCDYFVDPSITLFDGDNGWRPPA